MPSHHLNHNFTSSLGELQEEKRNFCLSRSISFFFLPQPPVPLRWCVQPIITLYYSIMNHQKSEKHFVSTLTKHSPRSPGCEQPTRSDETSRTDEIKNCFPNQAWQKGRNSQEWLGNHFFPSSALLQVVERTSQQIKQLRKGLAETGIWPLLIHRRDLIPVLFPRESEAQVTPQVQQRRNLQEKGQTNVPHEECWILKASGCCSMWFQMILECITWPSSITVIFDSHEDQEKDDDDECCEADVCRVSNYLRKFIENGLCQYCRCYGFKARPLSCPDWPFFLVVFFKHSISSWAQEPRKVLGRVGGAGRRDEGGNSGGRIPDGFNMLREAEAAEALHTFRHISSRAVCLYSNHLQRLWLRLRHNIHFKWLSLLCEINCIFPDIFLCLQRPIFFPPLWLFTGLVIVERSKAFLSLYTHTVTRAVA